MGTRFYLFFVAIQLTNNLFCQQNKKISSITVDVFIKKKERVNETELKQSLSSC